MGTNSIEYTRQYYEKNKERIKKIWLKRSFVVIVDQLSLDHTWQGTTKQKNVEILK